MTELELHKKDTDLVISSSFNNPLDKIKGDLKDGEST